MRTRKERGPAEWAGNCCLVVLLLLIALLVFLLVTGWDGSHSILPS